MNNIIDNLTECYKNGMDSKFVKNKVIESLGQYFMNPSELEKNYSSSSLLLSYEFIMRYSEDNLFEKGVKDVISHYRNALNTNRYTTINILLSKRDYFVDSENKMWNIRNDKPRLGKELFDNVMEYFRYTGSSLEISVKGIICELYALHRIINNCKVNYKYIFEDKFGHNINLLLEAGCFEDILILKPHNFKLSDWRNLAMHHSYSVEKDMVALYFDKANKNIVKVSYDEFERYVYQVTRSSNILNIARCIFVYDNMNIISKHNNKEILDNKFRDEMIFNNIKISLLCKGFKLINIFRDDYGLKVELQDLQKCIYDNNYIRQREDIIAHLFGNIANSLSVGRIDVKYYSYDEIIMDIFWISVTLKDENIML